MDTALVVLTHVLVGIALMWTLANAVQSVRRRDRIRALAEADPARRIRAYRRISVMLWAQAALVPLIVLTSADLNAADLGWAWPRIDGGDLLNLLAWTMPAALLIGSVLGGLRWRLRLRRGEVKPLGSDAPFAPRSPAERRPAAVASVSSGIVAEVIYRGLLIGVGTQLYQLPLAVVALVSLAIFVTELSYQSRRGIFGAAFVGTILTIAYIGTGSVLLGIAVHVAQSLLAPLVFPADATRSPALAAESAGARPTP